MLTHYINSQLYMYNMLIFPEKGIHVSSLIPCHAFSLIVSHIVMKSVIPPFIKKIDRQQIFISISNFFFSYTGDRCHDHPAMTP